MKAFYALIILFISYTNTFASTGTAKWKWAESAGGIGNSDDVSGICTDAAGNVFVTGYFYSATIVFGKDTLARTGGSGINIFVVKYDSAGTVLWAKTAAGGGNINASAITTDANDNVYITGGFGSPVIFATDTLIPNPRAQTFYIAKLNSSGDAVWAEMAVAGYDAQGTGISADASGNVYVTGIFEGSTITLGDSVVTKITSIDNFAMFIAKYNPSGNVIWAKTPGAASAVASSECNAINTNADGSIYATGYFASSLIFGTDTLIGTGLFIVKYDSSGAVVWAKNPGANPSNGGSGITSDANGNMFVAGYFGGENIIFDNDTLTNITTGFHGIFVVKYNSSGAVVWTRSPVEIGNNQDDGSGGISVDALGNVYITGSFSGSLIFDNDTLTSIGGEDIFIVRYNPSGTVSWAEGVGGTLDDYGRAIITDTNNNVYVVGGFSSDTVIFGTDTLKDATGDNQVNVFITKLTTTFTAGIVNINNPVPGITVYPNPTNGDIYFKGAKYGSVIETYNVLGEEIYSSTVDRDNFPINLTGKAKGIYFYRITDRSAILQQGKIILE